MGETFVIVEDHPLVRDALMSRIQSNFRHAQFRYTGPSLGQAIEAIGDIPVDCAILDLDLGDGRSAVLNTADLAATNSPVLIVSALADAASVRSALRAGALGFVSKNAEYEELIEAINATLEKQPSTSRDLAAILYSDETPSVELTDRERTAMVLYASGMKLDAVARRMGIQPGTASEYIKRVRSKYLKAGTPVPTKTDLYRRAKEDGLIN